MYMRAIMGSSLRLSASIKDAYRRRSQRSNKVKDSKKTFLNLSISNKSCKCKFSMLKKLVLIIILVVILIATCVTLLNSHHIYHHNHNPSHSASSFVKRLIWGNSDPRYKSDLDIEWNDMSKILDKLDPENDHLSIGLLNFDTSEINHFRNLTPKATHIVLQLDYAPKNLTWDSLYPEWIDEEEEEGIPNCPTLPKPEPPKKKLDLIAVKLPCRKEGNWTRDVARLHLQLAAAGLTASSHAVHVIFVTNCFPIPNLFHCKELVTREGNVWLYEPNLNVLKNKVQLPVGSCQLSLPLKGKEVTHSGSKAHKEAYATLLHSADDYVCGAIAVAQSIRMSGSTRDLVILVDNSISALHRSGLESAGWKIKTIQRIRNPKAEKDAYNEWNYSKFRLWQLTEYRRIVFVDSDLIVTRNLDFLFGETEISATGNNGSMFNSGVMVIEPSECTFRLLEDSIGRFESYNGGDQGFLNEVFTWWHRIPKRMNFLKNFWAGDDEKAVAAKTRLFGADPPELYVIHYLGIKPWMCYRDYDCNHNVEVMREFASDVAHRRWWGVHDAMPGELRRFCLLRTKQKAQLEWDRRGAEGRGDGGGRWRIAVRDRRKAICAERLCDWEGMLRHWGETDQGNWTDLGGFLAPTLPGGGS